MSSNKPHSASLSTEAKLKELCRIKEQLHPHSQALVSKMNEAQAGIMSVDDQRFVVAIYEFHFGELELFKRLSAKS